MESNIVQQFHKNIADIKTNNLCEKLKSISLQNKKRNTTYNKKMDKNNILKFDIKCDFEKGVEDDIIIKSLKQIINTKQITMEYIINKLNGNANEAYNLCYGLLNRANLTTKTLSKWLDILDIDIQFINR